MYSSVSVGVVHVLCACAQVRAGAEHSVMFLSYRSFVTILPRIVVVVVLVLVRSLVLVFVLVVVVLVLAVLAAQLIFAFLCALKIVKSLVFSHFFDTLEATNTVNADVFCASLRCFLASGSKHHGI